MTQDCAAVLAAEACRRDLLVERHFAELDGMLHADLSYVHLDGQRQNKSEYLAHVRQDFEMRDIEWEDARVRVHGRTALLDGTITNCLVPNFDRLGEVRRFRATALLVWRLEDRWRLVAYQGTRPR